MGNWEANLASKIKQIPSYTKTALAVLNKYGPYLRKYHGGMPIGFIAATIAMESGGNPNAVGDASLGEYGLLQVAKNTELDFQVPNGTRKTAEGNIFLGSLEYQAEHQRLALKFPDLVVLGSEDTWKLARLVFSVGRGGTYGLIKAAKPTEKGNVFSAIVKWANDTGAMPLGRSPAGKIKMRINNIDKVVWVVGQAVASWQTSGAPEKIPAPHGIKYLVPKDIRPYLKEHLIGPLIAWGAAAYIAFALI